MTSVFTTYSPCYGWDVKTRGARSYTIRTFLFCFLCLARYAYFMGLSEQFILLCGWQTLCILFSDVILIKSDVTHSRRVTGLFMIRTATNLFQNIYELKYLQQKLYYRNFFIYWVDYEKFERKQFALVRIHMKIKWPWEKIQLVQLQ